MFWFHRTDRIQWTNSLYRNSLFFFLRFSLSCCRFATFVRFLRFPNSGKSITFLGCMVGHGLALSLFCLFCCSYSEQFCLSFTEQASPGLGSQFSRIFSSHFFLVPSHRHLAANSIFQMTSRKSKVPSLKCLRVFVFDCSVSIQ